MALHWTLGSLPEMSHLSPRDRHTLLQQCGCGALYRSLIARSSLFAMFIILAASNFTRNLPAISGIIICGAAALIGFVALYQWSIRIIRYDIRQAIIKGFVGEKLPVCLRCGYNLTGTQGDICPECGGQIKVRRSRSADDEEEDDDAAVH